MVKGKVINVLAVEKITVKSTGKNLTKKDFVLADSTLLCRCIAWSNVEEDKSCELINVTVKSINGH